MKMLNKDQIIALEKFVFQKNIEKDLLIISIFEFVVDYFNLFDI